MNRKVFSGKEARDIILKGVNAVANPVGDSMGSKGRTTIIDEPQFSFPTKDGVTIARSVTPLDETVPIIKAMQDAARRAVNASGDGTSSSMVLIQSMVNEGMKLIEDGANPIDLKRGIDLAVSEVVNRLKEKAIVVENDYEALRQVATVSANNDPEMGRMIADAFEKVTKHGVIHAGFSTGTETTVDYKVGMSFEGGFADDLLQTSVNKVDLMSTNVFICDDEIVDFADLQPVIQSSMDSQKPLTIIGKNTRGQALATIRMNLEKGDLRGKINVINAPYNGSMTTDFLKDLAVVTGGVMFSRALGHSFNEFTPEFFGYAERISSDKRGTDVSGGKGTQESIDLKVEQIRGLIEIEQEERMITFHNDRIARLIGGSAVINVGANSDAERRERYDRVDDSKKAVFSAIEEGVVAGGGTFHLKSKDVLEGLKGANEDIDKGIDIVRQTLKATASRMMSNAGLKGIEDLVNSISEKEENVGYNLETNEVCDLVEVGIIDPVKVLRVSLESAASAAGMLLTTNNIITQSE